MSKKAVLLLSFITIFIPLSILATGVLLGYLADNGGEPEVVDTEKTNMDDSEPVISNSEQIGEEEEEETVTNRYLYAAIQPDFSIELIREDGSSLIATLEDKNWSSISVSPEGAFVAMLGAESFESPTNIYMYDISKQEVRQLTNLAADAPSVREYRWISPTEIGFSQGRAPDNWFHRIDVEAGSTTKLFRADASFKLFNIAESRATYLFPDGSRQVFNLDGTKVESEEMVEQVNLFSITCIVDAKNITGYSFNEEAGALSFFSYNISGIQREIETFFVDSNAQIIPQNNSCNKDGDFLVKINEINSSNPDFYLLDNQVGSATRLDVEKLERLIGIALF